MRIRTSTEWVEPCVGRAWFPASPSVLGLVPSIQSHTLSVISVQSRHWRLPARSRVRSNGPIPEPLATSGGIHSGGRACSTPTWLSPRNSSFARGRICNLWFRPSTYLIIRISASRADVSIVAAVRGSSQTLSLHKTEPRCGACNLRQGWSSNRELEQLGSEKIPAFERFPQTFFLSFFVIDAP
jgi:hypothetical protein